MTGYVPIEDGKHTGTIVSVNREMSQKNDYPKYKWRISLAKPSNGAAEITKVYSLGSKDAIAFMIKELALLGISGVNGRDDLEKRQGELIGMTIEFEAHTKEDGWPKYF